MIFSLGHKERFNRVFSKLIFTQEKILRRYSTGDANGDEADFDSVPLKIYPQHKKSKCSKALKICSKRVRGQKWPLSAQLIGMKSYFKSMQPINPNDKHDAEHMLYAGTTGAGKSVATQKVKRIKATDQVVIWDFYGQYQDKTFLGREVRTYNSLKTFFKAVYAGRKTNQGFKIAFTPKSAPDGKRAKRELFLKYCQVVWSLGDGDHKKKLHCIMEEINRVTITTGDEDSIYGELLEVGRKFGFVLHLVS